MHDYIIAEWGGIYEKLKEHFNRYGGRCVVDSAFSKGNYLFLLKSPQDPLMANNGDAAILSICRLLGKRPNGE